jgi:signal transduction histidine kinase
VKTGSLRLRLFAAGAASVVMALGVAAIGLLLLFERHVERRVVLELESDLRQLVSGVTRDADGALQVSQLPAEPRFLEPLSGFYWQIAQAPEGPVLRSRSLWDTILDLPSDTLADGEVHRHPIGGPGGEPALAVERSIELPASLGGGRVRVAVAVHNAEIAAAARDFAADLAPALAVLALVLIAAAWAQVTVGLRPLDAVRRRLGRIRTGDAARLGSAFPDEVRPLAAEVDHLLEAQENAIGRARARAADLAHGLKTPLTVLAAAAEDLRARGDVATADEVASVADGMRRHVERELARARAGLSGRGGPPQPVGPVIGRVVGVLRRTPRGHELDWQIAIDDRLGAIVDAQDLAEMLGNLAENAGKWAAGTVRFSGTGDADATLIVVEDDGPGIPDDAVGAALVRGGRLDEAQPGTGLGLAIVSDIVEAYGGSLTLGRSSLGGLRATIRLPVVGRVTGDASVR